jgi:hypothetical protein
MTVDKIKPYAKAIVAALISGLGALGTAYTDGEVSAQEWIAVASAFLVALGVVFGVPNKDPLGVKQDESVQPPTEPTVTSDGVNWADPDND